MAKVRTPNQKSKYKELNKRLAKYVLLVEQIYDELNLEAAQIALTAGYDGSKPFRFKDYPKTKDRVNKLKKKFVDELGAVIYRGTSNEWKQSNLVQDLLVDKVLKTYGIKRRGKKEKVYYQVNSDALKAFQERKDNGMSLSAKLWNQAANYRQEMEYAISSAVQKGTSAVTLSKRLSKYLQDFPKLQKDYKEKFGKAVDCHDCEYRSIRLARSEINMAYRTAEQTRWQQMDFVVGYEIKLSAKHPCHDVCDDLAGKYPKDFKWTGWHPNDMCYLVPILNTEEEFWSDSTTSVNEVKDVPEGFKKWVENNIQRAKSWESTPYFVKDNPNYIREDFKVDVYNKTEKAFVRKGRTQLAMSRVEYYNKTYPDIREVELAAINAYTQPVIKGNKNATSRFINTRLRNGTEDSYVEETSRLISKALGKLPKIEDYVYRGVVLSKKKFNDIYASNIGAVITEKGFMSTSRYDEVPMNFITHDGIKKNQIRCLLKVESKTGRDISKISEFNGIFRDENQYEILFDKGSKFMVQEIMDKGSYYLIRLVEHEG